MSLDPGDGSLWLKTAPFPVWARRVAFVGGDTAGRWGGCQAADGNMVGRGGSGRGSTSRAESANLPPTYWDLAPVVNRSDFDPI